MAGVICMLISPSCSARIAVGLCSVLSLGNLSNWALSRRMKRRADGEPAAVGIANLTSIPLLLSVEGDLTRFVAMLLVISLSYAWASLSYALKAGRVLLVSPEGEPLESAIREFLTTLSQGPLSSPVRLTIMLTLVLKGHATFSDLQRLLGLTPGNLGSHLEKLEREGYVERLRCLRGGSGT